MSQTEDMKRLLYNGNIVGQLRIFYAEWKKECVQQFFDKNKPFDSSCHKLVPFDSFEQGYKHFDTWWFINDRVQADFSTWAIGETWSMLGRKDIIKWQTMTGTIDQKDDGRVVVVWDNGDASTSLITAVKMTEFKLVEVVND